MTGPHRLPIEDVCAELIDYRGKTPPKSESGVRLITAKVVKGGRILDNPAEFIPDNIGNYNFYIAGTNDRLQPTGRRGEIDGWGGR